MTDEPRESIDAWRRAHGVPAYVPHPLDAYAVGEPMRLSGGEDEDRLPLELCSGDTPDCPHYECPDGWHPGDAPNCSCTPDCALDDYDPPDAPYHDGAGESAGYRREMTDAGRGRLLR